MQKKSNADIALKNASIFCTVAQTNSVAAAARRMGMSHSSVSAVISNLENSLGLTLFDRSTRPIVLTPEGAALYSLLSQEKQRVADLLRSLQSDNGVRPALKIGMIESATLTFGVDLVETLAKTFGCITMVTDSVRGLQNKLHSGEIELFLSSNPISEDDSLQRVLLFEEPFVVVLPRILANTPTKISWQWLAQCGIPMIRAPKGTYARQVMDRALDFVDLSLPIRFEIESTAAAIELVKRGLGWYLSQPLSLFSFVSTISLLQIRAMPAPIQTRSLYLVYLKGHSSSTANSVAEFCKTWLRKNLHSTFLNKNCDALLSFRVG